MYWPIPLELAQDYDRNGGERIETKSCRGLRLMPRPEATRAGQMA